MESSWKSVTRLGTYAKHYKFLLLCTLLMGVLGFAIIFLFPWLIGTAIDKVIAPTNAPAAERARWLTWLMILGGITVPISSVAVYGRGHLSVKLGNRIIADLRQDLFDHLNRLSLHFYSHESTGSIVSRLINDIQQASQIISGGGILLLLDVLQMFIGLVLLLTESWKIALACLAVMPLYALTLRKFNPQVKKASDRVQRQISKISGSVHERLAGIALVKTFATEDTEKAKFRADNEEYFGRVVQQSSLSNLAGAISEGLIHLGTLLLIGLGSYLAIWGRPPMTAGQIVKLLGWLGIMYGPVKHLAEINIVYQTSMAALDRVFQVFSVTPKIVENQHPCTTPPCRGEVVFDHVKFRYAGDDSETFREADGTLAARDDEETAPARAEPAPANGCPLRWVLDDLNFSVASGESIALVGPSGSGKSTLMSLLPRLYDISEGRILVDGVDTRDYQLKALRRSIGIVQQRSLVFSGTVRDNLCYGCHGVSEQQIIQAAKDANADEFIRQLPRGYDSLLGPSGLNLSGGQLQRLSIARALLRDPRILILDEATSALDVETEACVQEALERAMKGRTTFIIAHRLSTIRNVDRIFVLEKGKIVETGTHAELLEHDGLYARLARRQFADVSPPRGIEKMAVSAG